MNTSWCAVRLVAAAAAAGVLLGACTGSDDPGRSASPTTPASSSTGTPIGAGSAPASGPGAGSMGPASDTYTAPESAPYPTPGRGDGTVTDQTKVLTSLPGSSRTSCGTVGSRPDLRSGGIAMGNFQEAKRSYSQTVASSEKPELNFYVIPQHARKLTSATVRIVPAKGKATTIRSRQVEEAEPYSYFAFILPISAPGSYRFEVRSGVDQGCFAVSFEK